MDFPAADRENSLTTARESAFSFSCWEELFDVGEEVKASVSKKCSLRCFSRDAISRGGHICMHVPRMKLLLDSAILADFLVGIKRITKSGASCPPF